tara:strand:- start:849 stop:1028 length:180 start_codon:yes stop_codon:yes gene_type:complete
LLKSLISYEYDCGHPLPTNLLFPEHDAVREIHEGLGDKEQGSLGMRRHLFLPDTTTLYT